MNFDKVSSAVCRLFFIVSFLLLAVGIVERLANGFGYTLLGGSYTPGRLLELAGILLIFVVAILLRQIREALKKS